VSPDTEREIGDLGFERYIRNYIENDSIAFNPVFYREHNDVVAALADAVWSGQSSVEMFRCHEDARLTWDTLAKAGDVKVPALILCGADDDVSRRGSTPVGTAKRVAELTPGCELFLIPNTKHMTFWDGTGGLAALQEFLLRHPIGNNEPTLLFFRSRPAGWTVNVSIASSMQSLETSFFLIALRRYPHALSTCASAIESAIQAAEVGANDRDGLQALIRKAKQHSPLIADFSDARLETFREIRNRITHRGFSPKDDSETTSLFLDVGLPFLALCYRELHSFDLMDGLLQEYVEHLNVATRVHERAKNLRDIELSYCLNSFGHLLRWCLKGNFSSAWEFDALTHSEEYGGKFDRMHDEKQKLEHLFDVHWSFDCPICDDVEAVVCEIDSQALDSLNVIPKRIVCTNCGFVVRASHPFLSEILLENQIANSREQILEEHGL
jgi:transcription elongation factor Elf1